MTDVGDSNPSNKGVECGFLEEAPKWRLESRFFPCKVGYKPAWLALSNDIPLGDDLFCSNCNRPKTFLCQIYSPINDNEKCFHRTLFIFMCSSPKCLIPNKNTGFTVLRSQLSRINHFYPHTPPIEAEEWRTDLRAERFVKVCDLCGLRSNKVCGTKIFCSEHHENLFEKFGEKQSVDMLFPEYEIVCENENELEYSDTSDEEDEPVPTEGTLQDVDCEEELSQLALSEPDELFKTFKKKVRCAPDQVLRYDRMGKPLWVTDKNIPDESLVPNCEYCSSKRVFEFQVLPQMLNYLKSNEPEDSSLSIDWGTLAVFTCAKSCNPGPDYKKEYLIKQDFVE